jgi:hypothetical protein
MEEKVNVWKANLTNGLILALVGIAWTLIMYFTNMTFNEVQKYLLFLILGGLLYFLLKSYRDNFMHGQITYGESVGAGVVIFLYYSFCIAIFTYILYAVIDPGLVDKQLAFAQETMEKKDAPKEAIEQGMKITKKIMQPGFMATISILGNMFKGTILSLVISIFIKKEGNPLIDTPEN